MKKMKTLSILLVFVMTLSLGVINVTAAEDEYCIAGGFADPSPSGPENAVILLGHVQNGTISEALPEDNVFTVTFSPDPGMRLLSYDLEGYQIRNYEGRSASCEVTVSGDVVTYTLTLQMDEAESFNGGVMFTDPDTPEHYNQLASLSDPTSYYRRSIDWVYYADVVYTDVPQEPEPLPDLYAVRVESNPAGVATFSGYGTGFQDGEAYDVGILSQNPDYEFAGWTGSPNGNISGADVNLVANFNFIGEEFEDEETPEALEVRYEVTAVSEPAGVGTFTGEGSFRSGDSYKVEVVSIVEGYEFVRFDTVNEGVIDGADVEVVAVFEMTKDDEPVDEPAQPVEEPDEVLDEEEIPEDVDALPDTSGLPFVAFAAIGAMLSGSGVAIRRRKR